MKVNDKVSDNFFVVYYFLAFNLFQVFSKLVEQSHICAFLFFFVILRLNKV